MTLKQMMELNGEKEKSLLQLKKELMAYKDQGMVFYSVNIAELLPDEPFELYFAYTPSKESYVDAFPVPKECFRHFKNGQEMYDYLKHYFTCYYKEVKELNVEDFGDYILQTPHVGNDYVWYYKIIS